MNNCVNPQAEWLMRWHMAFALEPKETSVVASTSHERSIA